MAETMTLIAGRTMKQGQAPKDGYREVASTGAMNQDDRARLGLNDGDQMTFIAESP